MPNDLIKSVYKNDKFLVFTTYDYRNIMRDNKANFNGRHNCWELPFTLDSYSSLLKIDATISDKVHEHFSKKINAINSIELIDDLYYKTKPYQHQKNLTNLAVKKNKAFFLCGVGTGKTKSAIDAAINLHKKNKVNSVLVICPASIIDNFVDA